MRQVRQSAAVLVVVLTASLAAEQIRPQTRVVTVQDFRQAMADIGDAFGVIEWAVSSNAYLLNGVRGDALSQLETTRRNIQAVRTFFADRKKEEATMFADDTLASLAALREELAAAEPNEAAAAEVAAEVNRTCAACHKVYRDGDLQTGYRFKAGALD